MSYLWVFIGGGLGSLCRYVLARLLNVSGDYPWGTLLANGLSCIILGVLLAILSKQWLSTELRFLLITGFCGGFSTFSTFSHEVFIFLRNAEYASAAIYLIVSVIIGLTAIWIGMKIID